MAALRIRIMIGYGISLAVVQFIERAECAARYLREFSDIFDVWLEASTDIIVCEWKMSQNVS